MAHKFDAKNKHKLDNEKRRELLPPEQTLIDLGLHEGDEKENFLSEVKRIIKPNGKIAIVEWKKVDSEFGPPIDHRLDRIILMKILDKLGFSNIEFINISDNFYGIIAEI